MKDAQGRVTPKMLASTLTMAEVAELLGLSRQRVGQLAAKDPTFPRSGAWRNGSRLWHRAGIEAWAAELRSGRIDPNPMAGAVVRLVRHARARSAELGFNLIDSPMFWLGFFDVAEDRRVADVLATVGVSRDDVDRTLERIYVPRGLPLGPTMSPHVQQQLGRMARRAREAERTEPTELDVAITLLQDEIREIAEARPKSETNWLGGRRGDAVLMALERRGLDPVELRQRLEWVEVSPASIVTFAPLTLKRLRTQRRRTPARPPWLPELAKNPLGHDPWAMGGFGSVFFLTPDGREYMVDGYQWFFHVDADGYPVRTLDGRPVGYRWQMDPPAKEQVRDFEVLPMPPDPVGNWPDYRDPRRDEG